MSSSAALETLSVPHEPTNVTRAVAYVRCSEAASSYLIRNIFAPHTVQVPRVAGLPFLKVTGAGLRISRLVLHFMQYASIICLPLSRMGTSYPRDSDRSRRFD